MKKGISLAAGFAAVSLLLGGCAVSPPAAPRYYETVSVAPPPPYVEYVGAPPVAGHIWISGFWNWGGSRYAWVPGRWEAPRPGYVWVPHRWERDGDRWHQQGGQWERRGSGGQERHMMPPQARREEPRAMPMERSQAPSGREMRRDREPVRDEHSAPERNVLASAPQDNGRRPEMRLPDRVAPVMPVERHDDQRTGRDARQFNPAGPAGEPRQRQESRSAQERAPVAQLDQREERRGQRERSAPRDERTDGKNTSREGQSARDERR